MARASWTFELLNLAGTPIAFLAARTATITRRLNGSSEATLVLDAQATGVAEIDSTSYLVRCWRRGPAGGSRTLRHAGKLAAAEATDATDEQPPVTLTVPDPLRLLDSRLRDSAVTYTAEYPRDIVASLVADEQARAETHLQVAAGTAGPQRDRTYERGKNIGEIIQQLAEVQNGYYYRVDPVTGAGATVGELVLLHPNAGSDRVSARFERGEGTIGNLTSLQATTLPPVNRATGFGAGDGEGQLVVAEEDATSISNHGLYETSIQHVDVVIEQTLRDHCTDALRPNPRVTLALQVATPGAVMVPSPWDDFDVGDTVYIRSVTDSPLASVDTAATVTEFTVSVDESGNETLTGLQVVT